MRHIIVGLFLYLPLIPTLASGSEDPQKLHDPTYLASISPEYKHWLSLTKTSESPFEPCKYAINQARQDNPFLARPALNCFKANTFRGSINFTDRLRWLNLAYEKRDPESAERLGDIAANGTDGQKPDLELSLKYYKESMSWWEEASLLLPVEFKLNAPSVRKKIRRYQNAIDCALSTLVLFDLNIKCSNKTELDQAFKAYSISLIHSDPANLVWIYDGTNITGEPSVLVVKTSGNDRIASLEYVLTPNGSPYQYYLSLIESLIRKYGSPHREGKSVGKIGAKTPLSWRLKDGLYVKYRPLRYGKASVKYSNPYVNLVRRWDLSHTTKTHHSKTDSMKGLSEKVDPSGL